jgi:hypothetical protein
MQGDFASFVDSLYGTTTTKLEPTEILAPSSLEAKKPSVNWTLWAILLSVGILLVLVFLRYFQKSFSEEEIPEVRKGPIVPVEAPKVNPILQNMQPLYEPSANTVPEPIPEPETFPIEGPIPISDESETEDNTKLSADGNDIQEYLRRREAVTQSLEKPNN